MKFNEKLVKLRKTNGHTQEDLAEKLGVTRQAVARWEAGDTTPDMAMLLGLCEVFSVSADYLIHDDYESDEDIPVVKEKNEEISAIYNKHKVRDDILLFSLLSVGIVFGAMTVCLIIDAFTTRSSQLRPPFYIVLVVAYGLTSLNLIRTYFKLKLK